MSENTEVTELREVPESLQYLRSKVAKLESGIVQLKDMLAPIIKPHDNDALDAVKDIDSGMCDVSNEIHDAAIKIHTQSEQINDLLKTVQL